MKKGSSKRGTRAKPAATAARRPPTRSSKLQALRRKIARQIARLDAVAARSAATSRFGPSHAAAKAAGASTEPTPHNALAGARAVLERLQTEDATTGEYSVENCAAMLNYWQARFLDADKRVQAAKGSDKLRALSDLKTASDQAGEWEKRKAGAMASRKVDLLKQVLEKLDEQDRASEELLEIDE